MSFICHNCSNTNPNLCKCVGIESKFRYDDILNLNDLWIIDNYSLEFQSYSENLKLLSSVFFGFLLCGFRLDDKASNQFWINLMEKIKN